MGNLEDLKDYHINTVLPKLEQSVQDSEMISELFKTEESRLARKYGRYCINYSLALKILEENSKFFSSYHQQKGLTLDLQAMLIKPVQRITKYHLFLTTLAVTCSELGYQAAHLHLSCARDLIRSTVEKLLFHSGEWPHHRLVQLRPWTIIDRSRREVNIFLGGGENIVSADLGWSALS